MLSNIQAFILGIIQGLTEFLPISSTGHLFLGRHLFGLDEAGLFLDTMLHVGTLLAVLVVYKDDLIHIIRNPFGKLTKIMFIGTIPAVFAGFLFKDFFDSISKSGSTIGWEFLATGCILWWAESAKRHGHKKLEEIRYSDALVIGTFQVTLFSPHFPDQD